jgi:hypothetical protein
MLGFALRALLIAPHGAFNFGETFGKEFAVTEEVYHFRIQTGTWS